MNAYIFMQISLGYLLPISIIVIEETISRKRFEKMHNLGCAFVNTSLVLFIYVIPIIVFESAAVLFHAITCFLNLFGV